MVIACPSCHTRFRLDEARLKGDWTKVRCSRCRHLFQVSREGQVEESPPDAWSLPVGEESSVAEAPASDPHTGAVAPPDLETSPPAAGPVLPGSQPPAETAAQVPAEAPPRRRGSLLLMVVLVVVAALLGLALAGGVGWYLKHRKKEGAAAPEVPAAAVRPPTPEPPPPDLQDLAVVGGEPRFQGLVNPKGGRLLVLSGEVHNRGDKPRGPVRLKATVADPQNQPLQERLFFAGSSFTDEELKKLNPEELDRWLDTPGGRSRTRVVRPGEKQPFAVIFFHMPERLALSRYGYTVKVVEGPVAGAAPSP